MHDHIKTRPSYTRVLFGGLALLMVVLLVRHSQLTMEHMRRGMLICVRTMIPSLFPFMVVSELVVKSGAGAMLSRYPAVLFRPLLGLPSEGVCALMLGWLCGFPVGSRVAADYVRAGRLTKRQFNLIVCTCNVPSSAFLISAVGLSLFGNAALGRWLLALTLVCALAVGVLFRFLLPRAKDWQYGVCTRLSHGDEARGQLLPAAISSAAQGMLNVCATVLLFSAFVGTLTHTLDALPVGAWARTAVYGLFELSTGVCSASALTSPAAAAMLCAAIVGWGGLSVHCQVLSVCDGCPVAMGWFWLSRALQALLCGGGMALLIRIGVVRVETPPEPTVLRELMVSGSAMHVGSFAHGFGIGCNVALLLALFVAARYAIKKRRDGAR